MEKSDQYSHLPRNRQSEKNSVWMPHHLL